jgi:GT2 family glycosyltransferase
VLSAACLVLRRSVLDKVGLLAEDYFLFSEENDLFWRMRRQNHVSHYVPSARVVHVVGASRSQRGELDSQVNFLRSRLMFFRRCRPGALPIVRFVHGLFLQWSLALAKLSALVKGSRESDYLTLYRRLWDVVRDSRPA